MSYRQSSVVEVNSNVADYEKKKKKKPNSVNKLSNSNIELVDDLQIVKL